MDFLILMQAEALPSLSAWDIIKVASPIVVTLSGAVGVLWKVINNSISKAEKREFNLSSQLLECNNLHRQRDELNCKMSEKIGRLEGMMTGHKQAREDLQELSQTVINIINERG